MPAVARVSQDVLVVVGLDTRSGRRWWCRREDVEPAAGGRQRRAADGGRVDRTRGGDPAEAASSAGADVEAVVLVASGLE